MPYPGKFIVVEGLEGAGKTTAMQTIADYLQEKKQACITTREPGGTRIGEIVRSILKESVEGEVLDPRTELLLVYAARVQHVEELIKPAMHNGVWVVSDRFELSTIAYQGGGRGMALDEIQYLSAISLQGFVADLTFFLDISPELGLYRAQQRGASDRFEKESADFFYAVHAAYHKAIAAMEKVVVIDASQPLDTVQESIRSHLDLFFKK